MQINDGGPAYPVSDQGVHGTFGMSLRDRYAIAALQSGQASNWRDNDYQPTNGLSIIENTAICAYQFADAMLQARSHQ